MRRVTFGRRGKLSLSIFLSAALCLCGFVQAVAAEPVDFRAQAEARKSMNVESNEIPSWPTGPAIGAQSAILMDAENGTILYEKNIHDQLYPASTTKIMTCLLAMENCSLDEIVGFSHDAVYGIERASSNVGIDEGQEMTMEECLYCVLLGSANEVAWAVGEHVGGTLENFVDMMNQRARELGCLNTHFNNSNGLPDPDHYTTAYDMALIAKEFFKNETLSKISGTSYYTIYPSAKQPDEFLMKNHHKMNPKLQYAYDYMVGGKTGYTDEARQTLVSCAEKNGFKLVCVVLKEESPDQFLDTIDLFNYGFDNFQRVNIAENEPRYTMENADFFNTNSDIFGSSKKILSIDQGGEIMIPNTAVFTDAEPKLTYDTQEEGAVASLDYSYHGVYVGSAQIEVADSSLKTFEFGDGIAPASAKKDPAESEKKVIFVNIRNIIIGIAVFVLLAFSVLLGLNVVHTRLDRKRRKKFKKRRRPSRNDYDYEYRDLHF